MVSRKGPNFFRLGGSAPCATFGGTLDDLQIACRIVGGQLTSTKQTPGGGTSEKSKEEHRSKGGGRPSRQKNRWGKITWGKTHEKTWGLDKNKPTPKNGTYGRGNSKKSNR